MYNETICLITLGMRTNVVLSGGVFKAQFQELLSDGLIRGLFSEYGPAQRRRPVISGVELIMGLIFHVLSGAGSLAVHMKKLTGKKISDSALSQRREGLAWEIFDRMLAAGLRPRAELRKHPQAFYHGWRLCGIDGSRFSVANTPTVKAQMDKAVSRRMKAAFAKVGVAVMVELALHNPIAAAIGYKEESEMKLAEQVLSRLPAGSLLLGDRYYGVPKLLVRWEALFPSGQREFVVRVRSNLKTRLLQAYGDGSALVEIRAQKQRRLVREITGRVRRGKSGWTSVRLWTSLLDWQAHPAAELLALYARRWEQECFYRELKVDMRSSALVQSHTPLTAAQEIAALVLAYAILVDERIKAARMGHVEVLRISFLKTLEAVRGLWSFLELSFDLLQPGKLQLLVRRTLREIAEMALPKRRSRSCPRAIRQPVSSWPRLLRNTYETGPCAYEIIPVLP